MASLPNDHFEAFPAACVRLLSPRPLAPPRSLVFDFDAQMVAVDTGFDRFRLREVVGDLYWFYAAQRLGGLLIRVLPTSSPGRVALFGSWESHVSTVSGVPEPLG
jgi:hypothetical protein